ILGLVRIAQYSKGEAEQLALQGKNVCLKGVVVHLTNPDNSTVRRSYCYIAHEKFFCCATPFLRKRTIFANFETYGHHCAEAVLDGHRGKYRTDHTRRVWHHMLPDGRKCHEHDQPSAFRSLPV